MEMIPIEICWYDNVKFKTLGGFVKWISTASLSSVPFNAEKIGYGIIQLWKTEFLFDLIDKMDPIDVVESETPTSIESLG